MNRLAGLFHEDVVMRHPGGWPEPGPSIGRDAVWRQFAIVRESWEQEVVPDAIEVDGERLIAPSRWVARGASSGAEIAMELVFVATIRDGKIVRLELYGEDDPRP
jgi:ketosteroid isomerase-like protein